MKKGKTKKPKVKAANKDVRPGIRRLWRELSKDQRKAVLRVMQNLGTGASNLFAEVKHLKSWEVKKDLIEQVDIADMENDDFGPSDDWMDKKSTGKDINCNQVFDVGGAMDVALYALLLQINFRTSR